MTTRILCATRERVGRCRQMIESFYATRAGDTRLWCYVAEDDPQVEDYRAMLQDTGVDFTIGRRRTMPKAINLGCSEFPGALCYGEVNDDHLYRTPGWDILLREALRATGGHGLAHGRTENLPGAVLVSGSCVRALGYLLPPEFRHQFVDNALTELYRAAGLLHYVPEVWIEHCHPDFGKAQPDATYSVMRGAWAQDAATWATWPATVLPGALEKLRGLPRAGGAA